MNKQSKFRHWVHELWLQNTDEHLAYRELPYTQEEYFRMYKYWLKREFKHQRQHNEN
jgi:hypothetical protein